MGTIFFLILFPILAAILLLVLKADVARDIVVKVSAALIAAGSIYLAVQYFIEGKRLFDFSSEIINYAMMSIEIILAVIIIILGIKYKKYLASLLALVQTSLMC